MNQPKKISVITISYNAINDIEKTIKSVILQDFECIEYIVIDGASTDGTLDVINKYKSHIDVLISEPDTGIYNAMNKGIRLATGAYSIFMNAGDIFANKYVLSDFAEKVHPECEIINGNTFYHNIGHLKWYRKAEKDVSPSFLYRSSICHQSTFIKTTLLKKYLYDENLRMVSDWKFWLQTIIKDRANYSTINIDVSVFDMSGVTNTQKERGNNEREFVISQYFSRDEINNYAKLWTKRDHNKLYNLWISIKRRYWLYYAVLFKNQSL